MKKTKYILSLLAFITATSCSDSSVDEVIKPEDPDAFPKGEVIAVDARLSTAAQTRAVGMTFEANDKLLAFVEAGKLEGTTFTPVVEEQGFTGNKSLFSKLLTFTFASSVSHETVDKKTQKSNSFTEESVYYWDDFSTLEKDLRDQGRGIRLKYGYCYNGGIPTSNYTEGETDDADKHIKNGKLEWTVNHDQKNSGTKTSDLLMAPTQNMIKYTHDKTIPREVLVMPFTHAMSQFTIEIQCGPTFTTAENPLGSTEISLSHVQVKCDVDATASDEKDRVKPVKAEGAIAETLNMHGGNVENNKKTFTAIVAPTNLTVGNILADISAVAGIPYQIYVTESLLNHATNPWKDQLDKDVEDVQEGTAQSRPATRSSDGTIERGKGYRTRPGVNYKLVVTVNKQKIDVYATITDWVDVEAEANGTINFNNDITSKEATALGEYAWFDVYRAKEDNTNLSNASFDERTSTTDKIDEATYYTKSGTTWSNTPDIFWPNAQDRYYFRALSSTKEKSVLYDATLVTSSAVSGQDNITIKNGTANDNDMIWGTTKAHSGPEAENPSLTYAEGAAIAPRTGDVPLTFKHILSKVSFKLKTSDDDAKAVDLEDAKIQITNIYNMCTLTLSTGKTSGSGNKGTLYSDNGDNNGRATTYNSTDKFATLANQIVTPQSMIDNDAMLIITLKDGTTYKVQLNQCDATDSNGNPIADRKIGEWKQGEHYTYTISLEKEKITLCAMVKEWDGKTGSGNATLDWD